MGNTLMEYAKTLSKPLDIAVVNAFTKMSNLLSTLKFETESTGVYSGNEVASLGTPAFRSLNEAYTELKGVLSPVIETIPLYGGKVVIDRDMEQRKPNYKIDQIMMAISAMKTYFEYMFFKGSKLTDANGFNGLQVRCVDSQLISAGSTSGGDALSLAKVDELLASVYNPTHLLMNETMFYRFCGAARTQSISNVIQVNTNNLGVKIASYMGKDIVVVGNNVDGSNILSFSESGAGGGSAVCTSIYAANLEEFAGVIGLQDAPLSTEEPVPTDSTRNILIRWNPSFTVKQKTSVARLYGIKNAAITA